MTNSGGINGCGAMSEGGVGARNDANTGWCLGCARGVGVCVVA